MANSQDIDSILDDLPADTTTVTLRSADPNGEIDRDNTWPRSEPVVSHWTVWNAPAGGELLDQGTGEPPAWTRGEEPVPDHIAARRALHHPHTTEQ